MPRAVLRLVAVVVAGQVDSLPSRTVDSLEHVGFQFAVGQMHFQMIHGLVQVQLVLLARLRSTQDKKDRQTDRQL